MEYHRDRRQDDFLEPPALPQAYYSDDDGRRPRSTHMADRVRGMLSRTSSGSHRAISFQDTISGAQEPLPPPPVKQRTTALVSLIALTPSPPPLIDQRRPMRVPDNYMMPPVPNGAEDARGTLGSGRAASEQTETESAGPQPAMAGQPATLSATTIEIGSFGLTESEGNGLPTTESDSIAELNRFASIDVSQRLSSSSGVLGDKAYRYTALAAEEFRLVRVLAPRTSQVKCEILHRPFGNPPSYTAISYAWGDPSDMTAIKIRDESFSVFVEVPIPKSLYNALKAVRRKGEDVLVWADALSIDQQDRDEKNQQLSLMAGIYMKARSVCVWLGPEEDDSELATVLLQDVAAAPETDAGRIQVNDIFSSEGQDQNLPALAALFEREYWNRLWVVQEIFNAARVYVYCGSSKPLPWAVYQKASRVFQQYKRDLEDFLPRNRSIVSRKQYSYSQILAYSGPGGMPDLVSLVSLGDRALLEVLRACRRKLASDPRDKVFGVLGVLGKDIREGFTVDYGKSVKEVFTDVVDFLLTTTEHLDVICEAIHFPIHISSANLPSWVPDWSHIPATSAISLSPGTDFAASKDSKAKFKFLDERRNRIQISAIPLGSISLHGVTVGTLCTLGDYLMAFLNWRALLLYHKYPEASETEVSLSIQEEFCETICLQQVPLEWQNKGRRAWLEACFHVFACLIQERLPCLAIDDQLAFYAKIDVGLRREENRGFLQDHFGSRMMGRCFCLTNEGRMGLGTGFMAINDEVVVPMGCSTPILLRPEGNRGEYRFVGDIYVDGYMHGEAMEDLDSNRRELKRYVIH